MEFYKSREYFVGIDSDGTAFDSMKIKHTHSFIPAAVTIFGLEDYADVFKEAAERINLYSMTRGINRFPGLLLTFKEVEKFGLKIDGLDEFSEFMEKRSSLSEQGVIEWIEKRPSIIMEKVLQWSRLGDKLFEKATENLPPFVSCKKTIEYMNGRANMMVVSAASSRGLQKDWSNAGISDKVDFIAGQEFGEKKQQLLYAKSKGFDLERMLMVGDAPGDYEAAVGAGVMFYPIIPGKENECWDKLRNIYFDMFISDKYDRNVEAKLYKEFEEFLKGERK